MPREPARNKAATAAVSPRVRDVVNIIVGMGGTRFPDLMRLPEGALRPALFHATMAVLR
jgi:hypothetical protein